MRMFRNLALAALCALALNACQKEANSLEEMKDAASGLAAHGEELMSALKNLDSDKIAEMGRIAAKFENAPAEAQKMLEKQGWTKDQFDKMVEQVKSNEELNKIFQTALAAAQGH